LFDVRARTTRPGVHGEPGTGFGLRTVKSFVAMFDGAVEVVSRTESDHPDDHGTTVRIQLRSSDPC
jgi:signal transduction histidine kinase